MHGATSPCSRTSHFDVSKETVFQSANLAPGKYTSRHGRRVMARRPLRSRHGKRDQGRGFQLGAALIVMRAWRAYFSRLPLGKRERCRGSAGNHEQTSAITVQVIAIESAVPIVHAHRVPGGYSHATGTCRKANGPRKQCSRAGRLSGAQFILAWFHGQYGARQKDKVKRSQCGARAW